MHSLLTSALPLRVAYRHVEDIAAHFNRAAVLVTASVIPKALGFLWS